MRITRGVLEVIAWFVIVTSATTTNGAGRALPDPLRRRSGCASSCKSGVRNHSLSLTLLPEGGPKGPLSFPLGQIVPRWGVCRTQTLPQN